MTDDKRRPIPHLNTPAKPLASCAEIARELPAYHDGTLKPRNAMLFGYIKNHLTHCKTCQASNANLGKS